MAYMSFEPAPHQAYLQDLPNIARLYADITGGSHETVVECALSQDFRLTVSAASYEHNIAIAGRYLRDAVGLRSGTVPADAFVEIDLPPLTGCYIREERDEVYFAWEIKRPFRPQYFFMSFNVADASEFLGWVNEGLALDELRRRYTELMIAKRGGQHEILKVYIDKHRRSKHGELLIADVAPTTRNHPRPVREFLSAVFAVGAALLRDFWIIEDRESVLGPPRTQKFVRLDGRAGTRIVYLPRVRYSKVKIERELPPAVVRNWSLPPRNVAPHFRNLPEGHKATERQRAIALLNGITLPVAGRTWVREHHIGSQERHEAERIYRSRSAVMACLEVVAKDVRRVVVGMNWYAFERACELDMRERGYEIVGWIGADGGIDIRALNKAGDWVIAQCKHWSKPVGPAVMRELDGARRRFQEHVGRPIVERVVLSSSGFTRGAREDASRFGIACVVVT